MHLHLSYVLLVARLRWIFTAIDMCPSLLCTMIYLDEKTIALAASRVSFMMDYTYDLLYTSLHRPFRPSPKVVRHRRRSPSIYPPRRRA